MIDCNAKDFNFPWFTLDHVHRFFSPLIHSHNFSSNFAAFRESRLEKGALSLFLHFYFFWVEIHSYYVVTWWGLGSICHLSGFINGFLYLHVWIPRGTNVGVKVWLDIRTSLLLINIKSETGLPLLVDRW